MATKKREKRAVIVSTTREQAEQAFAHYAADTAEATRLRAEIDARFAALREEYAQRLSDLDYQRESAFSVLQAYATEHREELFADRKSLEMLHGTIGFRTGTPRVKQSRGVTVAETIERMREQLPDYVRHTLAIDKTLLLLNRETPLVRSALPLVGLEIVQDEAFFVEPKTEDPDR